MVKSSSIFRWALRFPRFRWSCLSYYSSSTVFLSELLSTEFGVFFFSFCTILVHFYLFFFFFLYHTLPVVQFFSSSAIVRRKILISIISKDTTVITYLN